MGIEIAANLLAGLALFFIGVKFIGENMKQMAGRGFRRFVGFLTRNPLLSALAGLISGALVQSATAVTFIMTSLVSGRLLSVSKSRPIIAWANIGNSLIVLLAVLDLRLIALFLMGGIGVCYYMNLDKSDRHRTIVGAGMGLGMLMTGLIFMKAGAAPLKQVTWLAQFLSYTKTSYLLAFLAAALVTLVAQSSTTVAVVAIAMARAGLLGQEQTLMIIYGSNFGSGLSVWFMSSNLRGSSRQLALYQALFKVAGAVVLVPWFYLEIYLNIPGVQAFARFLSGDFGKQMAYVFLFFQLAATGVLAATSSLVLRLMQRICPASAEEELNRPQYIYEQALEEPETALDLAEKECLRLVRHLPDFLDAAREETSQSVKTSSAVLSKALASVSGEVKGFVTAVMGRQQSRDGLERALNLQSRFDLLGSLAGALDEFVTVSVESKDVERLASFSQRSAEALHMILTTAVESAETPDEDSFFMLQELTSDRADMMVQTRRSLAGEKNMDPQHYQTLLALTALFERIIWLLRRLGMLLVKEAVEQAV